MAELQKHTMIAWMEDKPGVLQRVAGLFRRRNFNIESLAVGHSETPGISRMTFVARGTDRDLRQIQTQLYKLINVTAVKDVTDTPNITREVVLVKVKANDDNRATIMQMVEVFGGLIVDMTLNTLIVQIVASEEKVDALLHLLDNFGIVEMVRSGRVTMVRGDEDKAEGLEMVPLNGHK